MRDAPPRHEVLTVVDDVAAEFAEQVVEAFHYRPEEHFTLALSGGPVAATCYERLATHAETQVDWWHVELFFADECQVEPEHPDCHERLARTVLLDRVGAAHLVHPLRDAATVQAAGAALEGRHLDLVHLDLGPDGRLSSLFPGAPAIGSLFGATRDPSGVAPHGRWSIGHRALDDAGTVVVTASGERVRRALADVRAGADVPGTRLRARHVVWLADHDAVG
jgi:6-phosphogluconolactonase